MSFLSGLGTTVNTTKDCCSGGRQKGRRTLNNRLAANRMILKALSEYIERDVDVRFFQALVNLNIIKYKKNTEIPEIKDDYFLESKEILETLRWEFTNEE